MAVSATGDGPEKVVELQTYPPKRSSPKKLKCRNSGSESTTPLPGESNFNMFQYDSKRLAVSVTEVPLVHQLVALDILNLTSMRLQ